MSDKEENHRIDRRGFLGAAAGAAAVLGAGTAAAPSAAAAPGNANTGGNGRNEKRIDTHHHVTTPGMRQWAIDQGLLPEDPEQWPRWANWDLDSTLEVMDANDIELGVASSPLPTSIVEQDPGLAREAAQVINEDLAQLARDHPDRFGFFAYLPLPEVEVSIDVIRHALDDLGADGVLMTTHVGQTVEDGRFLGDEAFDPLFAELNDRDAVVMTHPDSLPGQRDLTVPGIENYVADFLLATTRTAMSLINAETLLRYERLSVILSHGGGFLPYAASRLEVSGRRGEAPPVETIRTSMERFYYDTALPTSPSATPTLLETVPESQILFGTDWPARTAEEVGTVVEDFDQDPNLRRPLRRRIGRANALHLFPRIARRLE